jgi:hypothetical protein
MKRILISIVVAAVAALGIVPATAFASSATLYNSLAPPQGNIPSQPFQAQQTSQFGNEIMLTRSAKVGTVTVTMSSWGCQSGGGATCVTTNGATFKIPITLNIYQAPATNPSIQPDIVGSGLPGALIKSVTKTFSIPYRPSASSKCTGGAWFDSKNGECFNGFMTNIKFDLGVKLPQTIVFGIAYNTSQYGAAPNGCDLVPNANCPDDSLNVGLSSDPGNLETGHNVNPGGVFWSTITGSDYCDGGAAGAGTFRFDSPSTPSCWGDPSGGSSAPWYIPAVKFSTS